MNFQRNLKFFKTVSSEYKKAVAFFMIAGLILFVIGCYFSSTVLIPALIMLAISILMIVATQINKATISEIEYCIDLAFSNCYENALQKLCLDKEEVETVEPIILKGYVFENIPTYFMAKQCSDGVKRSSNIHYSIYLFSEEQLYIYHYFFSLVSECSPYEVTEDHFYNDIDVQIQKEGSKITFNIFTNNKQISEIVNDPDGNIERSLYGLRNLIRNKRKSNSE